MRTTWRVMIVMLLGGIWPQLGCLHGPGDKSVQDSRPLPPPKADVTAKKEPVSVPARFAQAETLERANKISEAIAAYEKLREPGSPDVWQATKRLAFLYLQINDLDRAEDEYRRLLQQNPNDADTLCHLGDINYRRAHWGTAEKMYRDALLRKPDHAFAQTGLGFTLAQQNNKISESVEVLAQVLSSKAEAHCQVAAVLKRNGQTESAMRECQKALSIDPAHQRARTELTLLHETIKNDPAALARLLAPPKVEQRGLIEVEPSPLFAVEGTSRLLQQRPTLPPLPDFDLKK